MFKLQLFICSFSLFVLCVHSFSFEKTIISTGSCNIQNITENIVDIRDIDYIHFNKYSIYQYEKNIKPQCITCFNAGFTPFNYSIKWECLSDNNLNSYSIFCKFYNNTRYNIFKDSCMVYSFNITLLYKFILSIIALPFIYILYIFTDKYIKLVLILYLLIISSDNNLNQVYIFSYS